MEFVRWPALAALPCPTWNRLFNFCPASLPSFRPCPFLYEEWDDDVCRPICGHCVYTGGTPHNGQTPLLPSAPVTIFRDILAFRRGPMGDLRATTRTATMPPCDICSLKGPHLSRQPAVQHEALVAIEQFLRTSEINGARNNRCIIFARRIRGVDRAPGVA